MNDVELWQVFIAGLALPVVGYWLKDGLANFIKTRRARKERLAADEAQAQADEESDMRARCQAAERRVRVLDDYAHNLRAHIANRKPPPPPPWPPSIAD